MNKNKNPGRNGLFGKTRQAVLDLLYGQTGGSFYTRQILDAVGSGRGAVQRELKNLTDAGIIIRETQGRQVYYRANEKCPIFNELKSMVGKTPGATEAEREPLDMVARRFRVPKERLAEYCRRHHIKKLSLYGSVLRDDFQPDSDIDVLVEFDGPATFDGYFDLKTYLEQLLGRPVDLVTEKGLKPRARRHVEKDLIRVA